MKRARVLLSAYACTPGAGSEAGVGWNMVRGLAGQCELWVLTRESNRADIEAELAREPLPGVRFLYFDLPRWARWWKRGTRGVQLYYYLWQIGIYRIAAQLFRKVRIDLVHHATFGRYWTPSFLALLGKPFVWGPIGGGESSPVAFWTDCGLRGFIYELSRVVARWLGELDPWVRRTARGSRVALVATRETEERIHRLGARNIEYVFGQTGLSRAEIAELSEFEEPSGGNIRFISVGRLLHWKGYHLALRAFAEAGLERAEYWIVGSGPDQKRLERLAHKLGIEDQVFFAGNLPRVLTLQAIGTSHALVHMSLHDFSPTVVCEAMAAGRPVLCLDIGGPAVQVSAETGFKIPAGSPDQVIGDLAHAMRTIATEGDVRLRMSRAARAHATSLFDWNRKIETVLRIYARLLEPDAPGPGSSRALRRWLPK